MTTEEQPEKSEKNPTGTPTGERTQEQLHQGYPQGRSLSKGTFIGRSWPTLISILGIAVVLTLFKIACSCLTTSSSNKEAKGTKAEVGKAGRFLVSEGEAAVLPVNSFRHQEQRWRGVEESKS